MTGELRRRLRRATSSREGDEPPDAEDVKERERLEEVKSSYESLCHFLLQFLNAELKGDEAGKEFVATRYRDTPLAGPAPHVEHVPPGVAGAGPYSEDSSQPPAPRQVRDFLRKHGNARTLALFRRFRKAEPESPIYNSVFGLSLVGDLLAQGKTQDAIEFRDFYREIGFDCDKMFFEWAQIYLRFGRKELAADSLKKLLQMDPSHRRAEDLLKEAAGAKSGSDGP
jgi:hypothetical protein